MTAPRPAPAAESPVFDIPSLRALFRPRSIAIVGASNDPSRIGGRIVAGNIEGGFAGEIFPVNPQRDIVQGLRCYPSVAAIGQAPDLAIVAVPAAGVVAAVRQSAEAGARAAVVLSSGFAEAGPEGAAMQREMVAIARSAGMRLMGPNCMGFLDARAGLVASFTRINNVESAFSGVTILSQSGAVGAHFSHVMRTRRMRYDFWGSTGNQADVDFADCLAWLAETGEAKVVVGCLEGVGDGPKFIAALERARERRLPVVLCKIGRSEIGGEAASTHTAALAGSSQVFDEVLRRHGAHNAAGVEEALDIAYACSAGKFPARASLGLASTSGGFGVMMADAAAEEGLDVPALPEAAQRRLKEIVPFAGTRNPVDMTGQYLNDESIVRPMVEALFAEGGHAAAICYVGGPGTMPSLAAQFEAVAQAFPDRLLALVIVGFPEVAARLERAGCLVFEDPRRAVHAVAALVAFGRTFAMPALARASLPAPVPAAASGTLAEVASKAVLAQAGVPVVADALVTSSRDAAAAAARLGFPVVLKVVSPDIPHKSDIGGVVLGVESAEAAAAAYDRIMARVSAAAPAARIDGVLVSPQVGDAVEMILGTVRDEVFGPTVLLGFGGVFAEILSDTVLRLAPVSLDDARDMVAALKGAALLNGARGRAPADVEALARAISALSGFAAANAGWLASVDVNPLLVRPRAQGVVAVDALVVADGAEGRS